ncbi:MAG TPA: hypothetical protein VGK04_07885, partial [Thermoanaerobaculia bacterium]
ADTIRNVMDKPEVETAESLDLFDLVAPRIVKALERDTTDKQLAERLGIELAQARAWLKRLVADGRARKLKKPVRYVASALKLF